MPLMTTRIGFKHTKTTILVDLGGIFVHPPVNHKLGDGKSSIKLGRILSSSPWMDLETGKIGEDECFARVAELYGLQAENLKEVIANLRDNVAYDEKMLSLFKEIKQIPGVTVNLASNISEPDYQALHRRWGDSFWGTFDGVFTSGKLGVRKPNLSFYQKVLRETRAVPEETLFIDDQTENVLAAMSLGIRGIVGIDDLARKLKNFIGDPVERGLGFLDKYAGKHYTITTGGDSIDENYAQLLILEATQNE